MVGLAGLPLNQSATQHPLSLIEDGRLPRGDRKLFAVEGQGAAMGTLAMLIVGGLAIFANLKKIWLILFVIELVNVALFLVR